MSFIKLLAIHADQMDPTAYYRGVGCFRPMEKMGVMCDMYEHSWVTTYIPSTRSNPNSEKKIDGRYHVAQKVFGWASLMTYDVVFMQRLVGADSVQLARYVQSSGVPIWYDLDDDFWSIPETFSIAKYYNAEMLATI